MSKEKSHSGFRNAFFGGFDQKQEAELRLYVGLDASTSMLWFDKYALIAEIYPSILEHLQVALPQASIETWLFHRALKLFNKLAPIANTNAPTKSEYEASIAGGSAIADCMAKMITRAKAAETAKGPARTRVVLWTDGWNRLSQLTPVEARLLRERFPEIEIHLIALVHERIRKHFDSFVAELGLPGDAVFVFEHKDNLYDTHATLRTSAEQLLLSLVMGRSTPEMN